MKKINTKQLSRQLVCCLFIFALILSYLPSTTSALPLAARNVVLGSSVASANTTYNFTFTAATVQTIKSVKFQACDTATTCTQTGNASGFSSAAPGSALSGQPTNMGSGGSWTVDNTDATALRIKNTSNTGNPTAGMTANFTNVHNPSATNSTFFIKVTTYSDDAWSTAIDTGVIATSTAGLVTVSASVDETLTFTLATANVALGTLTSGTTGKGMSTMSVATNAATGYSVSYKPTATLTSGSNTIAAMTAGGASTLGTPQFGINLVSNTTPAVGANVSGAGTGTVLAGYNTANSFKFDAAGGTVAQAGVPTNSNTFTASYIANISDITPPGAYSTNIVYTATANF